MIAFTVTRAFQPFTVPAYFAHGLKTPPNCIGYPASGRSGVCQGDTSLRVTRVLSGSEATNLVEPDSRCLTQLKEEMSRCKIALIGES
jgi:hypothetical protein